MSVIVDYTYQGTITLINHKIIEICGFIDNSNRKHNKSRDEDYNRQCGSERKIIVKLGLETCRREPVRMTSDLCE